MPLRKKPRKDEPERPRRLFRRIPLRLESLEERIMLSTFVVNSFDDTVDDNPGDGVAEDGSGNTTLRAAVMEANALASDDRIELPAGTYRLTIVGDGEDEAATGDLDIRRITGSGIFERDWGTLEIEGAGADVTVIDASNLGDRVFHMYSEAEVELHGLTITGGYSGGDGGGFRSTSGEIVIRNSTIRGNVAGDDGGGFYSSNTRVHIQDSTIWGNTARGHGGGVYWDGAADPLEIEQCTISRNSADGDGGGLYQEQGTTEIASSTIAGNRADADRSGGGDGGGFAVADGTVFLVNTIVADNSDTGGGAPDVSDDGGSGAVASQDYNLIEDPTGAGSFSAQANDVTGVEPELGPLESNGGRTLTHRLLTGSPAIDSGDTALEEDQRGWPRPSGADDDIGAVEAEQASVPFSKHPVGTDFGEAVSVHSADVDGDGDLDILAAAFGADDIAWWENTAGDGSAWAEHTVDEDFDGARSVYAADVDGDGDLDVLGAAYEADDIAWWENTAGDGSAWSEHGVVTGFDGAFSVYSADVDDDGDLDVLGAAEVGDDIRWWENTAGDGTAWTQHIVDGFFSEARSVYCADVDGDGDLDILGAAFDADEIRWWENTAGDGSAWTQHSVDASFDGVYRVFSADMDGDGDLDVLGASEQDDDISWWENTAGDGSNWDEHDVDDEFDGACSVHAADVDRDGDLDFLAAGRDADDLAWWENTAGDGSTWTKNTVAGDFGGAQDVHWADVDGDGDLDVLGAAYDANEIAWWENETIHSSGFFPNSVSDGTGEHTVDADAQLARSVHSTDLDGDGDLDVVGAAYDTDDITWWDNTAGDGSTWTGNTVHEEFDGVQSVASADVDGDGDLDILGAASEAGEITWWENTAGDGSAWTEYGVDGDFDGANSVYPADVDGDGDLDVLGTTSVADDVMWWENISGDGSAWTEHAIDEEFDGAASVYASDVDGDGDLDVLGAAYDAEDVTWWENTAGDGSTWTEHTVDEEFDRALGVSSADLDGDGDLDVLGAARGAEAITWWENTVGDGSAWIRRPVDTDYSGVGSLRSADLDGDGDLDVVAAAQGDGDIVWWENTGGDGRSWSEHAVDAELIAAGSVCPGDFDGDGDLDLLGASEAAEGIAWWENRGGQFSLTTTDAIMTAIRDGEAHDLLKIVVTHRGRAGDPDVALVSLDLLFEESEGDPLTTAEGNALVENLEIYLDSDVDGVFSRTSDTLVTAVDTLSLAAGIQTVTFTTGDPNVRIQHGSPRTYFVVTELTSDASGQTPNEFRVTHRTESSSTARDWDHELGLTMEWAENTASSSSTVGAQVANQTPTDIALSASEVAEGTDASAGYTVGALSGTDPDTTAPNNTLTFSIEGGADAGKFGIDGSNNLVLTDGVLDLDSPTDANGDGVYEVDLRVTDGGVAPLTYDGTFEVTVTDIAVPFSELSVNASFDGAYHVCSADLDGDGDLDVLGASWDDDDIAWWENTAGDGSAWTEHLVEGDLDQACSVYAADVDGDGDLDVLGAAERDDDITWWENTAGDGTTWTEHTVDAYFDGARSVFSADVDGDGDLDVLGASGKHHDITWWENTAGDGVSWTEHIVDANFDGARCVFSADLDVDGDLDILGAALDGDAISWWENRSGDGRVWTEHRVASDFDGAESVFAADVDGDGDLDVLGGACIDSDVAWWENTAGDGTSWTEHIVDGDFHGAASVYSADVDGDGDLDVLGAASDGNDVAWWESDGTPRDGGWVEHLMDGGFDEAHSVHSGDLDGDGDLDVLAAAFDGNEIAWWENETIHSSALFPNGVLDTVGEYAVDRGFSGARSAHTGDVDGDGDPDVLAAGSGHLAWWENTGDYTTAWTDYSVDQDFAGASSVYPADLDGDGDLDALAAAFEADDVMWWENRAGDGSAWTEHDVDLDFDGAQSVYSADVDGDGDLDVLAAASEADDITWWENTAGTGRAWTEHTVEAEFDGASAVYSADVDGDGDLDVLGAAFEADDVTWWENTAGDGSAWTEHTVEGDFDGAQSVYAADVDGDGDLDVLAVAFEADDVTWWENALGDGSAWTEQTVDADFDGARSVYAADLDCDGDLDVLAGASEAAAVAWWENTVGDGSAWAKHTVDGGFAGASSVHATDVDGDGDLDILGTSPTASDVTWWENRGGQFALATTDTAPETIDEGTAGDLLKIVVTHQGRTGDRDLEPVTFDLLLEYAVGSPLSDEQANDLIDELRIYRDSDGNEAFDIAIDAPVTAVTPLSLTDDGLQTVSFDDDDVDVQIQHGTPRTYFVVTDLTDEAGRQTPNEIRITHQTESSSTGQERTDDIDATLEWVADMASSTVMALTPNRAPTDIDLSANTVAENTDTSGGHIVGALSGTDPDTWPPFKTLTFSIQGGADAARFSVDGSSNLVLTHGTPDFENPTDDNTDGVYEVTVLVTDGGTPGLTYDEDFTVTVTDVNEAPTDITLSGSTVAENTDTSGGYVVGALSGTDPDTSAPFNTLTFAIQSGDDAIRFSVDGSNNLVLTHGTPNFELPTDANADGVYEVTVLVTDGGTPGLTYDEALAVTVTDANDAPWARNMTQTHAYNEGTTSVALDYIIVADEDAGDTITATLTLTDPTTGALTATSGNGETYTAATGVWTITGTVTIVNRALADVAFTPTIHNDMDTTVTTHIQDAAGAGPVDGAITLDVTGSDDAPTATNLTQTQTYDEDAPSVALDDIVVTDVDTGDTVTATLTLSNTATGALTATSGNGETYTPATGVWTVTGDAATVNAALAAVAFIPAANNETDTTVTTHVQDAAGTGPADGTITLDVTSTNDAPTDIALSGNTVAENTDTSGGHVVGVLSGTDMDSNVAFSTLTFTIAGGADAARFSVDGSGSLVLTDGILDYEIPTDANADGVYEVTIRATDGGTPGLTYDEAFAITVTNVNEYPDVRTFTDGDGDTVTVLLWGPKEATAVLTRAVANWNDPGDLTAIDVSGSDGRSILEIRVTESGGVLDYGTTVGTITGPELWQIYAPQVDLVGSGVDLTALLFGLTVRDIADGADIRLVGATDQVLSVIARDVGDVDVQFAGILSRVLVEEWADGEIQVNYVVNIQTTDGDFGADLTLAGADWSGVSLNSADIAGDLDAAAWTLAGSARRIHVEGDASTDLDIDGDLGWMFRRKRRGRKKWHTDALWVGGRLSGDLNLDGNAVLIDVRGDVTGNIDVTGNVGVTFKHRKGHGSKQYATGFSSGGSLTGGFRAGGDVLRMDVTGDVNGQLDIGGDLGIWLKRRAHGSKRWTAIGLWVGGELTGGVQIGDDAVRIDVVGNLAGDIDVTDDLGGQLRKTTNGRRRWVWSGLWTGGSVTADLTVGGVMQIVDIDGDFAEASVRAIELRVMIVDGRIHSLGAQLVRALLPSSQFYISDITWSGYVTAGNPHVFDGSVTAQIG